MTEYLGHQEATAVTDPTADATVIAALKGLLTKLGVMTGASPVVTTATGSGAISTTYAPSAAFWLESVTLKLSSAPAASEDFVITLDANAGAAYDVELIREDLSDDSVANLVYVPPEGPLLCESGDAILVTLTNSNGRTYGLRIAARLA